MFSCEIGIDWDEVNLLMLSMLRGDDRTMGGGLIKDTKGSAASPKLCRDFFLSFRLPVECAALSEVCWAEEALPGQLSGKTT